MTSKHRKDRCLWIFSAIVAGSRRGVLAKERLAFDRQRILPIPHSSGRRVVLRSSSEVSVFPQYVKDPVLWLHLDNFDQQSGVEDVHFPVRALSCRGGARVDWSLSKFFVGSRARCWAVLFLTILIDSCTITMIKVAQDEGSVSKLAISYVGYFLR
jgi:hypothetical protein